MAEPTTIYKMTVLNLLSKSQTALSNTQILQFFLDRDYTDYFTIQQTLSSLLDTGMIRQDTAGNQTLYHITDEGNSTLGLMRDKINPEIETDVIDYLREHKIEFRIQQGLSANYDVDISGGYIVHCKYTSENRTLLDMSLHVSSAGQAEAICNNWKSRYENVYMSLMDTLL
jgi:predicted transcriptional regulator